MHEYSCGMSVGLQLSCCFANPQLHYSSLLKHCLAPPINTPASFKITPDNPLFDRLIFKRGVRVEWPAPPPPHTRTPNQHSCIWVFCMIWCDLTCSLGEHSGSLTGRSFTTFHCCSTGLAAIGAHDRSQLTPTIAMSSARTHLQVIFCLRGLRHRLAFPLPS